jgi:WD40 repeat protein
MTCGTSIRFTQQLCSIVAVTLLAICGTSQVSADEDQADHISTHHHWVTSLAFSADGSTLVTGGGQSLQYRPGDVKIWDVASGSLVKTLGTIRLDDKGATQGKGHQSNVWSVALSADGSRLVTSGYNGEVIVWNVAEGTPIATLEKHKGWCRSVAFAPDSKHFATAGEDGTVVVWKSDGAEEVKELKGHESAVYQVAFSPDGNTLATASTDKSVKLWNWESGEEKVTLSGHEDAVWAVAFSKDGSLIATAGADRTIKLWDAEGSLKTTLTGHTDWVTSVAFSPDGKQLAAADYGRTVKLWNLDLAIKMGGEVTEVLNELKKHQDEAEKATKESEDGQTETDKLKKQAEAIAAVADARLLPDELKQAEAALSLAEGNRFFENAVEEAKAAAEVAGKAAEEQTKAFKDDKEFTEKLTKIKEGGADHARSEKTTSAAAATESAKVVEVAKEKQAAAEKVVAELKEKSRELAKQQYEPFGEFNSSVWCVSFAPDGKLATGSHKALQLWNLSEGVELFPQAKEDADEE